MQIIDHHVICGSDVEKWNSNSLSTSTSCLFCEKIHWSLWNRFLWFYQRLIDFQYWASVMERTHKRIRNFIGGLFCFVCSITIDYWSLYLLVFELYNICNLRIYVIFNIVEESDFKVCAHLEFQEKNSNIPSQLSSLVYH